MNLVHLLLAMVVSPTTATGLPVPIVHAVVVPDVLHRMLIRHLTPVDTPRAPQPDSGTPPLLGPSLRYGMDTTISPCRDFYQYINGAWRSRTVLDTTLTRKIRKVDFFSDVSARTQQRLRMIVDSARAVAATTTDPTLKALGTFYESCMVADSFDFMPRNNRPSNTPPPVTTRAEQCLERTRGSLGGALGQVFARELLASGARLRMEQLLEALRTAVKTRLEHNRWMTPDEKSWALERLQKLHLRVGIPTELVDYQTLTLSPTNYPQNTQAIANFKNRQMALSIGENPRERWKMSVLSANAMYSPADHAIEIPAVMFMPPFFDATGDDAANFAGIGMVIGHEIFHSFTSRLTKVERTEVKTQIEQFKVFNSSLGTVDGWNTDGYRTFGEDIADLGGVLVAYEAWKATLKTRTHSPAAFVDGFTPEQQFFVALGRVWRAKWRTSGLSENVHAAPFARVNAMVLQSPAFAKAFGCKDGDPMVLSTDKRASIW